MDNNQQQQQPNSLFNSFASSEHLSRRRVEQNASASQSPGPAYNAAFEGARGNPGFGSSPSANTSTQSIAGSTPQPPQKDISFSLLQALLKPQPPSAQTHSASQTPMLVSDLERSFGHSPDSAPIKPQGPAAASASPMEQLKRMMTAQQQPPTASEPSSHDAQAQRHMMQQMQAMLQAQSQHHQHPNPYPSKPNAAVPATHANSVSVHSSPPLSTTSDVVVSAGAASELATSDARNANKLAKAQILRVDVRKVSLHAKPESVLISLLQQPTRFRPGRLISVSRDYICYAVRSKEGGRIRVIHQFHGQSAKMQGHTDSISDMSFHPCSKEQDMPQILASLGKDNRLVVWLVGSETSESASADDTIAYEPFINVDSGEDARFVCLAWRSQIVDGCMELCVGTDMGFMVVKAPVPASRGKRSDIPNDGLNIMPVATDSAVTAIERAGLRWVVVATADHAVRIYELDSYWETCSQPYRILCEVTQCEHPVDTLVYIAPASAADGAGHLLVGHSMNRQLQLWWLGSSSDQIALIQNVSFVGVPNKSAQVFAKLAWAEQGRCLAITISYLPSAIFVLRSSGHGAEMALAPPVGYSLGEEQPTLSLVAAVEAQTTGDVVGTGLSVYGVHTRLVQQLQIDGFGIVERDAALPDPASIYSAASERALPEFAVEPVRAIARAAPVEESPMPAEDTLVMPTAGYKHLPSQSQPAVAVADAAAASPTALGLGAGVGEAIASSVAAQLQSQISAAIAGLQLGHLSAPATLDPESEAKLVDRISAEVERRVTLGVASAMEHTLIPAYSRATAAMFDQMQSTFESGLREWWMRFAQVMPPPPPPPQIATPLSHMVMMPQSQNQAMVPNPMATMGEAQQRLVQAMQQQGPQHIQAMNMPRPTLGMSSTGATAGSNTHIDSLMSILNLQPPNNSQPMRSQPTQQQQLVDSAIASHGQKTGAQMHN